MSSEFESLLSAAQAGAEWAWSRIYKQYAGPVRGYVLARGGAEPDDLVGETFVQLARNIGGFEGTETQFRSWVFMIAHNRILDERRTKRRRPAHPTEDETLHRLHAGQHSGDAEHDAMTAIAGARALAMLEGLSEDQRHVMVLRILGDLSLEQVAEVMDKNVGAVKALQNRALKRLRKNLGVGVSP